MMLLVHIYCGNNSMKENQSKKYVNTNFMLKSRLLKLCLTDELSDFFKFIQLKEKQN